MAATTPKGNKKVNENVNRLAKAVQRSRLRAVSKAKPGKYIDLPAVRRLRQAKFSLEEVAEMVGHVSRHAVHKWRCGRARPKISQREELLKSLKIPVEEWLTEQESKKLSAYLSSIDAEGRKPKRFHRKLHKKYLRLMGKSTAESVSVDR